MVAAIIVVTALGCGERDRAPASVRGRSGRGLQAAGRDARAPRAQATLAAGLVVLGLLALMTVVAVATVRGVIEQTGRDQRLGRRGAGQRQPTSSGSIRPALDDARAAAEGAAPAIGEGFLTKVVAGIGALVGLAGGLILGALIMYYLLKDGTRLRRSVVAQVDPESGARSTASSATRAGSSATTGGAAR